CGDCTNLVLSFGGELLLQAEALIRTGLHPSEIISGYTKAGDKVQEILEGLTCYTCEDIRSTDEVAECIKTAIAAKQYGYEEFLASLIAKSCVSILPKNPKNFNVDNVRVTKILGGGVVDSKVLKGFVIVRDTAGTIKHVTSAKVAVFAAGIDISRTETKGSVVLKTAEELLNYSKDEEKAMEEIIKAVSESGAKVVVSGGNIGEMAMHFLERYNLMAIKVQSKFQLRRLCKAVGAVPLVRMGAPTPEELGYCDVVSVEEIGSTKVCVFRQDAEDSAISTIIVRGSTQNLLDDIERAVDDGVNVFKGIVKDPRFVAGAGGAEIELARQLTAFAESSPGLDQYAIKKYAESLEIVPRILAENAGRSSTATISALYAAHSAGKVHDGVDVENPGGTVDTSAARIIDLQSAKASAIRLATDAALTILRVDQVLSFFPPLSLSLFLPLFRLYC
ncbi:T-complex protein 1 subunit theta, partial [Balamuthia mandrillaris]